jgi:hypothetical protein
MRHVEAPKEEASRGVRDLRASRIREPFLDEKMRNVRVVGG